MKKKLFIFCLAIVILVSIVSIVRQSKADVVYTRSPSERVSIEIFTSAGAAAAGGGQLASSITADNRLLGFVLTDSSAGTAGLYDAASVASIGTGTGVFAESYCAAGTVEPLMFPLPKELTNGLVVVTKNTTGVVMVFYE